MSIIAIRRLNPALHVETVTTEYGRSRHIALVEGRLSAQSSMLCGQGSPSVQRTYVLRKSNAGTIALPDCSFCADLLRTRRGWRL